MFPFSFAVLPLLLVQLTTAAGEVVLRNQVVTKQSVNSPAARLLFARQGCTTGSICGDGCIASSSSCCSQTDGTSCPSGYYCDGVGIEQGCCENGQLCSGLSNECAGSSFRCGADCVAAGTPCDDDAGVPSLTTSTSTRTTSQRPATASATTIRTGTGAGAGAASPSCLPGYVPSPDDEGCYPEENVYCGGGYSCGPLYYCVDGPMCRVEGFNGSSTVSTTRTTTSTAIRTTTPTREVVSVTSTPTVVAGGGSGGGSVGGGSGSGDTGGGQISGASRGSEGLASIVTGGAMLVLGVAVIMGL